MPKQTVNLGTMADNKSGDPLRTAFTKINQNFDELYGAYINKATLQVIVASSTDFEDFKTRIAAL
jgi:hypothetical protein